MPDNSQNYKKTEQFKKVEPLRIAEARKSAEVKSNGSDLRAGNILVLSKHDNRTEIASFAGRSYSVDREAVALRIQVQQSEGKKYAQLTDLRLAGFASGSPALQETLVKAEQAVQDQGAMQMRINIESIDLEQYGAVWRANLPRELALAGYDVEASFKSADGKIHKLENADLKNETPRGEKLVRLEATKQLSKPAPEDDLEEFVSRDAEIQPMPFEQRYHTTEEVREQVDQAINDLEQTASGKDLVAVLPEGIDIEKLIKTDHRENLTPHDFPTYIAGYATEAGLSSKERGTVVHRMAELRLNYHHQQEVAQGTRLTEQNIYYLENGKSYHIEMDTVFIRNGKHQIRDYKPINLAKFEHESEAGRRWAEWMEKNYNRAGEDFRARIRSGELSPVRHDAPPDLRKSLQQFMSEETAEHKGQLAKYTELYRQSRGLKPEQMKEAVVLPYFIYE
jgi:hypothetical protein